MSYIELRNSIDNLNSGILDNNEWSKAYSDFYKKLLIDLPLSRAYFDFYEDRWISAKDGMQDVFFNELLSKKELELGREIKMEDKDILSALLEEASDKLEEYVIKEVREKFYPEMAELHDIMGRVLSLNHNGLNNDINDPDIPW